LGIKNEELRIIWRRSERNISICSLAQVHGLLIAGMSYVEAEISKDWKKKVREALAREFAPP
jgi:hypothetical protein